MDKESLINFENKIAELYQDGKISGAIHLTGGNEEQLIEIFKDIKEDDWVFCTHRNHYHALLKGLPEEWIEKEIIKGNSMTINNPEHRFYSTGIVGDIISIALGVALKSDTHVWCFVGDMASRMGYFTEAVNYAKGHDLPITYIIEDNGLSVTTPTKKVWGEGNKENVISYSYTSPYAHAGVARKYTGF